MEELALANQNRIGLVKENKKMKEQMTLTDEKNVLLRSVAGGGVENVASIKSQFEKFQMMLESHEEVMKEQVWLFFSTPGNLQPA